MKVMDSHIESLLKRYPALEACAEDISAAIDCLAASFRQGFKLMVAGNGGSAADSEHIVGELMKEFRLKRRILGPQASSLMTADTEMGRYLAENLQGALPSICLVGQSALSTAFMNDSNADLLFAQQVYGYGVSGDVFWALSTSGNSANICYAAVAAKAKGIKVIALTGAKESRLSALADIAIRVPAEITSEIQELHLPVYHCICAALEDIFFNE